MSVDNLDSVQKSSSVQKIPQPVNLRKRHLDSSDDADNRNEDFDSISDNGIDSETIESDIEDDEFHDFHENKSLFAAVEALEKLKNSSTSSLNSSNANNSLSPATTTNPLLAAANVGPTHGSGSTSIRHNGESSHHYQQKFFNTVSNYYKSSKDFSPAFKVGAEFVEKRAIPIVRKFEQRFPNTSISNLRQNIVRSNGIDPLGHLNSQRNSLSYFQAQQQKLQNFNLNVSIESKKNLKVLLKILKLANNRLIHGVDNLQNLITEKEKKLQDKSNPDDEYTVSESKKLQGNTKRQKINKQEGLKQVKKDIVITVKKAVTVISKFTGNSLPEPARTSVRDVLLKLPENLSKALNTNVEEFSTPMSSAPGSPRLGPSTPQGPLDLSNNNDSNNLSSSRSASRSVMSSVPGSPLSITSASSTTTNNFLKFDKLDPNFTNRKILILAKESLDSFANIIKIFDANLNKMDDWVEENKQREITKLKNLHGEGITTLMEAHSASRGDAAAAAAAAAAAMTLINNSQEVINNQQLLNNQISANEKQANDAASAIPVTIEQPEITEPRQNLGSAEAVEAVEKRK